MAINHRRVLVSDGLSMIKPWLVIMCIFGHQKMVVMSKYGMRFLNMVIKIRFDRSECSSILLTYGTAHNLQMCRQRHRFGGARISIV